MIKEEFKMDELKKELSGEFDARLEDLGAMELGSEEYKIATETVLKYADRIIEIEKSEAEQSEKKKQRKVDTIDRFVKIGADVLKWGGSLGVACLVYAVSMKYEDKGLIPTTQGGRNALNQLLKFIK